MDERLEDLLDAWEDAQAAGQPVTAEELASAVPELLPELRRRIAALRRVNWLDDGGANPVLPPIGVWIAGAEPIPHYRLVRQLGRGGFGEVWHATGPGGLPVALKQVKGGSATELRALRTVQDIRHPHLLALHGCWSTPHELVIAAELADGTLTDELRRAGALPRERLLIYLRDAAAGLDALAAQGVTHRDVKPANLLLVGGRVKVGDYGLARPFVGPVADHSGALTVAYAAPEFFQGHTTTTSDQFSLALTYVELRTGTHPYPRTPAEQLQAALAGRPNLTAVPAGERAVLQRALHRDPAQRWPTCTAFAQAIAAGSPAPPPRRHRAWFVGLSTVVAVMAISLTLRPTIPPVAPAPEPRAPHVLPESIRWTLHRGPVPAVAFGPQGHLATGGLDGRVCILDPDTGVLHADWHHEQAIRCLVWTPAGDHVLVAGGSTGATSAIYVWHWRTHRLVYTLAGHAHHVHGLALAPDGTTLYSASLDGTVRRWNWTTGTELERLAGWHRPDLTPAGYPRQVWALALRGDGQQLLIGQRDGFARLIDTVHNAEIGRLGPHGRIVNALGWINGTDLLTGTGPVTPIDPTPPQRYLTKWDWRTQRETQRIPLGPNGANVLAVTADGQTIGVGDATGGVRLLDGATGTEQAHWTDHTTAIWSLTTDGHSSVSGAADGTVVRRIARGSPRD